MDIARAAIQAADPERLVREFLSASDFDFSLFENIYVLGAGKAGGTMARGVEAVFGSTFDREVTDGLVVVKDGYAIGGAGLSAATGSARELKFVRQLEAAHPVPDERGAAAARDLLALARRAGGDDLIICLISGGGSALMALPAPGLTLADIQQTVDALLKSGADIGEVNAVRKHVTMATAGHLAAAAYPAVVLTLIISDVIGDSLDVIASGPTVADESTYNDALAVLTRYSLRERVAPAVLAHLEAGAGGKVAETPKPGDPVFERAENHILGNNRIAVAGAQLKAAKFAYDAVLIEEPVTGEARDAAVRFVESAGRMAEAKSPADKTLCVIAGGEVTVTVTGPGTGGRAQEFVLAAAPLIAGRDEIVVFAFGTDGTDGPTDAAGAIADGSTWSRAMKKALAPEQCLHDNDAYSLFHQLGDLIITGPTGTNVNDVYGVIIGQL